jgi:hypothetical protein
VRTRTLPVFLLPPAVYLVFIHSSAADGSDEDASKGEADGDDKAPGSEGILSRMYRITNAALTLPKSNRLCQMMLCRPTV